MISMLRLLGLVALTAPEAAAFSRPNFVKLEAEPGQAAIAAASCSA